MKKGNVVNFPNKGIHNVVILKNCNYISEGIIIAGSPARVLHNGKKFYWKY